MMRIELERRLESSGHFFEWVDIKQDLKALLTSCSECGDFDSYALRKSISLRVLKRYSSELIANVFIILAFFHIHSAVFRAEDGSLSKHFQNRELPLCIYKAFKLSLFFSCTAFFAKKSNFPEFESSLICLSYISQSFLANHCLKLIYSWLVNSSISFFISDTCAIFNSCFYLLANH